MLDALSLSRLQFALTIMFHYIFPPLTIGLGAFMAVMEGLYIKTRDPLYEAGARFWTKIFAVNFAMGVATGIVMEFEFGTNWSAYSRFVGDVFGSALAAEGIFAFFLESGFLAVLVFGWDKVSPRMHFFSTVMVALGAIFSAVWIVVANSWQQTPAGYHLVTRAGMTRAEITDFRAMVFNPSSIHRLGHVLIGAFILGAFFVMSVSAYYVLKRRFVAFATRSFTVALYMAAVASLAALVSGHFQARVVAVTQPPKLAAFEGHFQTGTTGTPMYLFGLPDASARRVRYGLAVPGLLSLLVHGDPNLPVTGLSAFKPEDWPPVAASFLSFHAMLILGIIFILATLHAVFLERRGLLFTNRPVLWFFVFAVIGPYAANQAGWVAAEVGRQPWIVYGLLRTSDGFSRSVPAQHILLSIGLFSLIYLLLFAVWVSVLDHKIKEGPSGAEKLPGETTARDLLDAASRRLGAHQYW